MLLQAFVYSARVLLNFVSCACTTVLWSMLDRSCKPVRKGRTIPGRSIPSLNTCVCHAGYWSSWQGESVCNSPQMKKFLGLGQEDSCLGFYILGNSTADVMSSYRSKRGSMADKVAWL